MQSKSTKSRASRRVSRKSKVSRRASHKSRASRRVSRKSKVSRRVSRKSKVSRRVLPKSPKKNCYAFIKYYTKKGVPSKKYIYNFIKEDVRATLMYTFETKFKIGKPEPLEDGWLVRIDWSVDGNELTSQKKMEKLVLEDLLEPDHDANFSVKYKGNEYFLFAKLVESNIKY